MVGRVGVVLVLGVLSLAGCAGAADKEAGGGDDLQRAAQAAQDVAVQATAATGVIRGVVVDSTIKPIAGAQVSLVTGGGRNTTTNADGAFGFEGLAPGSYFLKANKTGFLPTQIAADVVAGVSDPPAVRVLLARDPTYLSPYFQEQKFDGFIECSFSVLALCSLPNSLCEIFGCGNVTPDRYFFVMSVDPGPAFAQSEWVWSATVPTSEQIDFYMENGPGCEGSFFNSTGPQATSPAFVTVEGEEFGALEKGSSSCGVSYRAFSGSTAGLPCVEDQTLGNTCIGATLHQEFTLFLHTFYGYRPPLGWRFTEGPASAPPS